MSTLINVKYQQLGREGGLLGPPIGQEVNCHDSIGSYQEFQNGVIYWSPTTGAHAVHGPCLYKWSHLGSERGLGYPITDTEATPDGTGHFNHFRNRAGWENSVYWTRDTGAHSVLGEIRLKWKSIGWEQSLGYPVTEELDLPGGIGKFSCFRSFGASTTNVIAWSFGVGAHQTNLLAALGSLGELRYVKPALSFYQAGDAASFKSKADNRARRMQAFGNPSCSNPLNQTVDSTPYNSGADIINAIESVYFCSGFTKKVKEVHIFSHGEGVGLYAAPGDLKGGLYVRELYLRPNEREQGGCTVDLIPTGVLANDVVFVLHSCGPAEVYDTGTVKYGPFAVQLWKHLWNGGLAQAKVFGQTRHHQYTSDQLNKRAVWKEFSTMFPKGSPPRVGLPGYEEL